MSVTEACRFTDSGTIDAGVPKVLGPIDMGGATKLTLVIHNTGSNSINSTAVEYSPLGGIYATDTALGTAIGSTAAGAKDLAQGEGLSFDKLRLTLNSSGGTTYSVEIRGAF